MQVWPKLSTVRKAIGVYSLLKPINTCTFFTKQECPRLNLCQWYNKVILKF